MTYGVQGRVGRARGPAPTIPQRFCHGLSRSRLDFEMTPVRWEIGSAFAMRYLFSSIALLFMLVPARAHIMSMSSGELVVEGKRASFELRMPLYEIVHLEEPERSLLENFRIFSGGQGSALA